MSVTNEFDAEATCAGRKIRSAMIAFSPTLLKGCKKFTELAVVAQTKDEINIFNTSCIFNAASYLEAKLNETISTYNMCYIDGEDSGKVWPIIKSLEKKLSVQEKWNLIATQNNGSLWSNSVEPFQSYEVIVSLRNELVHFKGEFLGRDLGPNRKIEGLMRQFSVESSSTWIEDDCSSWVTDLLQKPQLSQWVFEKITAFDNSFYELLHGSRT